MDTEFRRQFLIARVVITGLAILFLVVGVLAAVTNAGGENPVLLVVGCLLILLVVAYSPMLVKMWRRRVE